MVTLADGGVLVRGHRGSVALSGSFVTRILPNFVRRLDGRTDLASLLGDVDPNFKDEASSFLRLMNDRRYLVSGPLGHEQGEALAEHWSLLTADPVGAMERIATAKLLILGDGETAKACVAGLRDLGARRLETATRSDLSRNRLIDSTDGVAAMVLASDGMSLGGVDVVNEVALERGIPWLLLRIDRTRALIGPHHLPGETACFSCYELRARANAERPEEHAALHQHWRNVSDTAADLSTPPGGNLLVGRCAAQDMARWLASRRPSAVAGCIISLDLQTLESTRREVLRLPRCPACSRLRERPMTRIWEIPTTHAVGAE
jgi:bacteriocin biosynthesis cyclodehydratase domain-containing protein